MLFLVIPDLIRIHEHRPRSSWTAMFMDSGLRRDDGMGQPETITR
jgi:hypothetical protein